jgi:hypothetical protein
VSSSHHHVIVETSFSMQASWMATIRSFLRANW